MKTSNPTPSKALLQNFPANDAKLLLMWAWQVHVLLIAQIPWLEIRLSMWGIELVLLLTTQPYFVQNVLQNSISLTCEVISVCVFLRRRSQHSQDRKLFQNLVYLAIFLLFFIHILLLNQACDISQLDPTKNMLPLTQTSSKSCSQESMLQDIDIINVYNCDKPYCDDYLKWEYLTRNFDMTVQTSSFPSNYSTFRKNDRVDVTAQTSSSPLEYVTFRKNDRVDVTAQTSSSPLEYVTFRKNDRVDITAQTSSSPLEYVTFRKNDDEVAVIDKMSSSSIKHSTFHNEGIKLDERLHCSAMSEVCCLEFFFKLNKMKLKEDCDRYKTKPNVFGISFGTAEKIVYSSSINAHQMLLYCSCKQLIYYRDPNTVVILSRIMWMLHTWDADIQFGELTTLYSTLLEVLVRKDPQSGAIYYAQKNLCIHLPIDEESYLPEWVSLVFLPWCMSLRDTPGNTPLHFFIEAQNINIKSILTFIPPEWLEAKNEDDLTPLDLAFEKKLWEPARVLAEHQIKTGTSAASPAFLQEYFFKAMKEQGGVDFLPHLLDLQNHYFSGFNLNFSESKSNRTPWWYLANSNDVSVMCRALQTLKDHSIDLMNLLTHTERRTKLVEEAADKNRKLYTIIQKVAGWHHSGTDQDMADEDGASSDSGRALSRTSSCSSLSIFSLFDECQNQMLLQNKPDVPSKVLFTESRGHYMSTDSSNGEQQLEVDLKHKTRKEYLSRKKKKAKHEFLGIT